MAKMKEDGWRGFLDQLAKHKTLKELDLFLELFLTSEERKDLAKRFLLIKALLDNRLTQREIADTLGVSISKITRGSNALKIADPKIKEQLKRLL